MAILCCSALTFNFSAHANLENDSWLFHLDSNTEYSFVRMGTIRGSPMISLEDVVKLCGLEMTYDPENFEIKLKEPKSKRTFLLKTYSETVIGPFGGIELSRRPEFFGLKLGVPLDFGDRILRPLLKGERPLLPDLEGASRLRDVQVVIDPGHGGNDRGTGANIGGKTIYEKELTLAFAKELELALKKKNIRVAMTRKDDVFLTLPERTHFANLTKAKLFLSLHLNFAPTQKSSGYELYVLSLNNSDSEARAAVAVENQMIPEELPEGVERAIANLRAENHFQKSLGVAKNVSKELQTQLKPFGKPVKAGPFYVLYGADMPALLLEMGFLNNPNDQGYLLSAEKREAKLVKPLANAISAFLK